MNETRPDIKFDSRAEFESHFRHCLSLGGKRLQLLDPDFKQWPLDASDVSHMLRQFLLMRGARLELLVHAPGHVQNDCPRFIRLLRDFGHAMECRITPKHLHQLTDSFCLADGLHAVRRFHSAYFRGSASFNGSIDANWCGERFNAVWQESSASLSPTCLGL